MEFCGACARGDRQASGIQWCEECKDVLCNDCEIAHRVNKLTLDHHLTVDVPTETPPTAVFYAKSDEFKVNIEDDVKGFIITSNGEFLFVDDNNDKLILYDPKEKCIIGTCKVPARPRQMVAIPGTTNVALACYFKGLYFLNYKTMTLGKNMCTDQEPCYAVAIIDNKLVAGMANDILFYSMSGNFLSSISRNAEDGITSICKGPNNTFIYMESRYNRVFCIDDKGQELWFYETTDLESIDKCFVDDKRSIYVCSCQSGHIHQLSPDGMILNDNLLDEYPAEDEMSWDFLFHKDFSEIYLLKSSNNIVVYERK